MATKHRDGADSERVALAVLPPPWPELTPERAAEWMLERCGAFAELIAVGLEDEAVPVEPKRTRSALSMLALDLDAMRSACARVTQTRQVVPLERVGSGPEHLEDLALLLAVDNPAYDFASVRAALARELVLRLRGVTAMDPAPERARTERRAAAGRLMALILIPAVLSLSSCSLAGPATQSVSVIPSHPNAEVYVDGNLVGRGAQTVDLSRRTTHSVLARCGSSAGAATIGRELSSSGVLDIIGGILILVPFVGLLAPGSYDLMPNPISVPVPNSSSCS